LLIVLVFYVVFLFCFCLRSVPCVPSVFSFVFVFVLCIVYPMLSCQFLWIVHSLSFIYLTTTQETKD
jgi:hypothetical protein